MKRACSFITLVLLSFVGIAVSSCSSGKPEQLNLILRVDANRPASLGEIVSATATRTGMQVESQDFDYGGKNGLLKTYSMSGSRISLMIRATSNEECHPREGRRDPTFSRSVYGVSIYRTSMFKPNMALQEVATVLGEEANRRGGALVPESQNCVDTGPESPKGPNAR
jgi:hypothetical protein